MESRILISGGGLGGLSLAQGLKKAGLPFHVFERIPAADFRAQGYRIKVNDLGAASLKDLLDVETLELFEQTCAGNLPGVAFVKASSNEVNKPKFSMPGVLKHPKSHQVDRTVLRDVLLCGLEQHISFGKELKQYTLTPNGITAHFSDGTSETGSLLVGAEGLRSPSRLQFLPEHNPIDTDLRCLYGKSPLISDLIERISPHLTKGMTVIRNEEPLTLFLEVVRFPAASWPVHFSKAPTDYVYWVLGARKSFFGSSDSDLQSMSKEELVKLSLALTAGWHPAIRAILEFQDPSQTSLLRIASALPDMPAWQASERITLLGDAIHVMPPTGGIGANTAFRDAANLWKILVEEGLSAASIGKYEEMMREYAREAIVGSAHGGKMHMNQPPFDECEPLRF